MEYPALKKSDGIIVPRNSSFDESSATAKKRRGSILGQKEPDTFQFDPKSENHNVRKYHKRF